MAENVHFMKDEFDTDIQHLFPKTNGGWELSAKKGATNGTDQLAEKLHEPFAKNQLNIFNAMPTSLLHLLHVEHM